MLKLVKYLISSSLVLCFLASCVDVTDNQLGLNGEGSPYITFDVLELETKVSNGDDIKKQEFAIWIYDSEHQAFDSPLVDGYVYHLKWHDTKGRWYFYNTYTEEYEDISWGVGKHNFFAYNVFGYTDNLREHDYNKSTAVFGLPFDLDLAKTGASGKKNYYNDVICASATREDPTTDRTPVSLTFNHVFSALKFTVNNETDEIKTISDFKIYRFCTSLYSRADISFNTAKSNSWSTSWNESNNYTADTLIVRPGMSRTVFGSPVMLIPQSWDQNEINQTEYHIPKLTMTIKTGDETTGETLQKNFNELFGQTYLEGGKLYSFEINMKNLLPVYIENVSSQIVHETTDDKLSHSKVVLDLGLLDKQLALLSNLKVTVTKDGRSVLTQTFDSVPSNTVIVSDGSTYLPQGTYGITLEYSDTGGTDHRVEVGSVTSPAPVYNVVVNLSATATGCTLSSVDVGISDNLLNRYGLDGSIVLSGTTSSKTIASSDFSSSNLLEDTPFTDSELQSLYFEISTEISFDNAQPTIKYSCSGCSVTDNRIYVVIADPEEGDYFYSDGTYSATYYSDKELVGIVFYVADENDLSTYPTKIDTMLGTDYPECTRGLVMGIPSGTYATPFNSTYPTSAMWGAKAVTCNTWGALTGVVADVYDKMTGYTNTVNAKNQAPSNVTVNCLNELNRVVVTDASSWYLPTIAECDKIRNLNETINIRLTNAGKNSLLEGKYCVTLSEETSKYWVAYNLAYTGENSSYSSYMTTYSRTQTNANCYIVPIFAF